MNDLITISKYIIFSNASIRDAIKKMDNENVNFLVVVNKFKKVKGVFTNGDFRKAVIDGLDISESILKKTNKKYVYLNKDYSKNDINKLFKIKNINNLPVIENGKLINLINKDRYIKKRIQNRNSKISKLPVVIMAGGKGTRLKPFTDILPKALMPLGQQPIIRLIIEEFSKHGSELFYISLNDKSEMIKAYFQNKKLDYKIKYVNEKLPLGTIGSLGLIKKKISKTFFVVNCDVMIHANYEDVLEFHKKGNFAITIVASMKQNTIQYGVCKINKSGQLKKIDEKPEFNFLVNTGFYLIEPIMLKFIQPNSKMDATDLINIAKKKKLKVGVFPISNNAWSDIGQFSEYSETLKKFI
jgi:dTDP-glucose pyrophosphorylase/predicted transcriptional regulator